MLRRIGLASRRLQEREEKKGSKTFQLLKAMGEIFDWSVGLPVKETKRTDSYLDAAQ
jgi:hypothetical protein